MVFQETRSIKIDDGNNKRHISIISSISQKSLSVSIYDYIINDNIIVDIVLIIVNHQIQSIREPNKCFDDLNKIKEYMDDETYLYLQQKLFEML